MRIFIVFVILLLVVGCRANSSLHATDMTTPTATIAPTSTYTATITTTSTQTFTPTPVPTSTPTPTRTLLPADIYDNINSTYKMMVLIQANAEMLLQTAEQVRDKKLTGFNEALIIMTISGLLEGVDKNVKAVTPPDLLEENWDHSVYVHEKSKSLLVRWTSGAIKSPQVASELASLVASLESTITETENMLGEEYDFNPALLDDLRQEVLDAVSDFFVTPTP